MDDRQANTFPPILWAIFGYGLRYISYSFLAGAVLPTFTALMIIFLTIIGPELPLPDSFSYTYRSEFSRGIKLDETDIMRIYGILSMVTFVLLEGFRAGVGKIRDLMGIDQRERQSHSILRPLFITSLIISFFFASAVVALPSADLAEDTSLTSFYWIVAGFYAVAMVSNTIFTTLNWLACGCLDKFRSSFRRKRG